LEDESYITQAIRPSSHRKISIQQTGVWPTLSGFLQILQQRGRGTKSRLCGGIYGFHYHRSHFRLADSLLHRGHQAHVAVFVDKEAARAGLSSFSLHHSSLILE
jgi:hypothetical protein